MRFAHIELARNHQAAFAAARSMALYLYGHGRKTDTIADKTSHKFMGEIGSRYLERMDEYWTLTEAWYSRNPATRAAGPSRVPAGARELFAKSIGFYLDPEGPAVCFRITGSRVQEIKEAEGKKGTWDKVFWFGGTV